MANRSYLYSLNLDDDKKIIKVNCISEQSYSIPVNYQILAGINPQLIPSKIFEEGYAILDEAKGAKARLESFYQQLVEAEIYESEELQECYQAFFKHLDEYTLDYFLFEPYEVVIMDEDVPNEYIRKLYNGVCDYDYVVKSFLDFSEDDWSELGVDPSDYLFYELSIEK